MVVDVTPAAVKKTALAMGVPDKNFPATPSLTLGTMNASTWDMAGVYATLDNHGKKVTPTIVKSAVHRDRTMEPVDGVGGQVISRASADTVTKALTEVVDVGSGREADTAAYDAAGKTGTAEDNKAAWFTAYTPELTTAVALFGESTKDGGGQVSLTGTANSGRANGGGFPARIWADYTLGALGGGSNATFDLEGVERGETTVTETPSATPSETPEPSRTPSEEPETPSATPSETPGEETPPAETPSGTPSVTPSVTPSTTKDPEEEDWPPGERPGSDSLPGQ
jgi:membrane peptidoglycan carboxypeptidase